MFMLNYTMYASGEWQYNDLAIKLVQMIYPTFTWDSDQLRLQI